MNLPQGVESKFRFILIVAKRARQLQAGAKPLVHTPSKKVTKIAMQEVEAGLVPVENLEKESEINGKKSKG
ncbi:MAG: DNA-directed RNA polymerase subunit omega [Acidobacteria bacterium]|nr:MAG: DNA-directed RNA polymerase subunit omega [Acidobacteriota bacterium]